MESRSNNFDIIRFFMAWCVIYAHAYSLTKINGNDVCNTLTNGGTDCGFFAVAVFFIISGYLICISFVNKKSNISYLYSRIMRIFPALIVVVLITIFIVGPILTTLPIMDYFGDFSTYLYGFNIFLIHVDQLPGVFNSNPFPNAVNGSLWTLICEFALYIYIFAIGNMKLLKKEIILLLFFFMFILYSFFQMPFILAKVIQLFLFFNAGMLFYLYKDIIKYNYKIFICSITLLILSIFTEYFAISLLLFLPYITMFLCIGPVRKFSNFTKFGDFSYGIYIYAFLIQQILLNYFNDMSIFMNVFITTIIALIFSFLSWTFIEKRFIQKAKNYSKKVKKGL